MNKRAGVSNRLHFIKIGGSIITDKTKPLTLRPKLLKKTAADIAALYHANTDARFIIGNGAGSYGHYLAQKLPNDKGSYAPSDALQIHAAVAQLNNIFVQELSKQGVPVIGLPAASYAHFSAGTIVVSIDHIRNILKHGGVISIYGDMLPLKASWRVASTEKLFIALAKGLLDDFTLKICCLVTNVDGVLDKNNRVIPVIQQSDLIVDKKSNTYDVTGGMVDKIKNSHVLAQYFEQVSIVNGMEHSAIQELFQGKQHGTRVLS